MEQELLRSFEEMQSVGRDHFHAAVAGTTALTRGMQDAVVGAAEYSRRTFDQGARAVGQVLSTTSFDAAIEIQHNYARSVRDAYFGEVNRLGRICLALALGAFRPYGACLEAQPVAEPAADVPEMTEAMPRPAETVLVGRAAQVEEPAAEPMTQAPESAPKTAETVPENAIEGGAIRTADAGPEAAAAGDVLKAA